VTKLEEDGYTVDKSHTYIVPFDETDVDRGSVFIDGRGDTILIYVEKIIVHTIQKDNSARTGTQATTSTPSTVADIPQGAYIASDGKLYPLTGYYSATDGGYYPVSTASTSTVQQARSAPQVTPWYWSDTHRDHYRLVNGKYEWASSS
jgi:hypothetical protein